MKSIRATIDVEGRVELLFGYDSELVDLVKSVSGFSWNKAQRRWFGSYHALVALQFAAQKLGGTVTVSVTWPIAMAQPFVVPSNVTLRPYQSWMAGVLSVRREFCVCWSPRTGKTYTLVHAAATTLATRVADRVLVLPPAGVTAEWQKSVAAAFPQLAFFSIEGTPIETEQRKGKRAQSVDAQVKALREKLTKAAVKLFKERWAAVSKVPPTEAQLATAAPAEMELLAAENALRAKLIEKHEKARAEQAEMLARVRAAHFVACQHDLVAPWGALLLEFAAQGPFTLCVDEIQAFNNEKAPRSAVLIELANHKNCKKVWSSTGTPMRNRPEDLVVFYSVHGGIGSGKWPYLKRYAGAFEGEYGWETGSDSNLDELAARFASVSHRLTREDVKGDLPAIDRKVTLVALSREEGARYKALEAALGKQAMRGRGAEANAALRTLVSSVLNVKLGAMLERVAHHVGVRGVKILVGFNFHESLQAFCELLGKTHPGAKFYVAGGWMGPERRAAVIQAWKDDPEPSPLLVNVLSSSVGIDLSAAEGTLVGEVPWVPSDAMQFEARILDVHLGTRTAPPWVEYFLAAGTVDEDMAHANLKKLKVIDEVVGGERESRALAHDLRASGVVPQVDLGLENKSQDAVDAAQEGLRRRLMGLDAVAEGSAVSTAAVVGAIEEAFDDDEHEEEDENGYRAEAG